jgi:GTP-binding protein HflX
MEQVREPDPSLQIGKGKAEELAKLVSEKQAERVIFGNELKPQQAYNLAKVTGVEIIDRFQLILEIFAHRASTTEAKLQIQLANLRYELPRAKEKVKLAKKGEQPGFRGLGAYEVDVYYETIRRQIHSIQRKLKTIRKKRDLHRTRRFELGYSVIALAGYTNAGKSSLFNILTKESVPVDSGLFTTLSTTTRAIELSGRKVLLTDTVGFIDDLPLTLIEAFHSTLEETIFSDMILLVVDVSESLKEVERKLLCCLDTIQTIGAAGIPIVTALNKIDLLSKDELQRKLEALKDLVPNPVPISALHGWNLLQLKHAFLNYLEKYVQVSLWIPWKTEAMSFVSWLHDRAEICNLKYEGNGISLTFESLPWFADKVKREVEQLGGVFNKH